MKKVKLFPLLFCIIFTSFAQKPVLRVDFEDRKSINTTKGINGKAFDLGDVPNRFAFAVKNPIKSKGSFTITLWARGNPNARSSYDILTGVTMVEERGIGWKPRVIRGIKEVETGAFNGWKIGMQSSGAWSFVATGGEFTYEYAPTSARQSIRDGTWHLLAVSYDNNTSELRFYYDGEQVAIYNAPELVDMVSSDSLVVGNSVDSDFDYRRIEWDSFYGQIDDIEIYDRVLGKNEIGKYYQELTGTILPKLSKVPVTTLKVTAFNILNGGNEPGKDVGIQRVIELIRQDGADILTLVETYGSGEKIADALGYQLYLISSNLSIISRYPIENTYRIFEPFNSGGALVNLPGGEKVNVYAVWLNYRPRYNELFYERNIDLDEFLMAENETRGKEMNSILGEIASHLSQSDEVPLIMGGDFNSGSHLDWINEAGTLHNGHIISWPVSIAAADAGLLDGFRLFRPDPLKSPGITHTTRNDRIDYVYFKGRKLKTLNARVINEHNVQFPSDHYGVSVLFGYDVSSK